MTAPYLGGFRITGVSWLSSHTLLVRFTSSYGSSYFYQLYAGRTLIGVTGGTLQRAITGALKPSTHPQHITLAAVSVADRLTDLGPTLPLRPYNRVKLRFTTSSWPSDAKLIEVRAGTTPGGAVDATNVIERVLYDTDREYAVITPALAGTGTWKFETVGVDNRPAAGNAGTALALSQAVLAHPPDVQMVSGVRLAIAVASQQATVSFTE